jgi:hypothetical protein
MRARITHRNETHGNKATLVRRLRVESDGLCLFDVRVLAGSWSPVAGMTSNVQYCYVHFGPPQLNLR